ncbi:metacaspase [Pholiota molesta]|nr:metacaspase [Pholiota molesta]
MWPNYDHQRPSSSYNGGPPPDSGFAMPTPAPGFPTPQHNYNSDHLLTIPSHAPPSGLQISYRARPGPFLGRNSPSSSIHVQNYGPHFQDENNMIVRPYFQYSNVTGRRRRFFWKLKGCINDVKMIEVLLFLQAMEELVRDAQPHDSFFSIVNISISKYFGHGGQVKDTAGDEVDGEDEGYIVDNLIHETMVKPLPAGCRLTAIFDSCHSGTAMDLPYVTIKEPNLIAEAGRGLLTASTRYTGLIRTSAVRKAEGIMKATRTSPADVVSLCSCEDSQLSAEVNEAGQAFGALSYVRANKHQSYQELLGTIRNTLKSQRYSQILSISHQLSSSHPMDHEVMFIC